MADLNRREFVALTAIAACACALATEEVFAAGPAAFDAGAVADFEKDGAYDKFVKPNKLLLVRNGGKLTALNPSCPHKNCPVKIADSGFKCTCHGSTFTNTGDLTKGPAKTGLSRYKISINDAKHVIVDLSAKLDVGAAEGEVEVK